MKAGFIVPSWHYWADPFKLQPLWEMYYATVLNKANKGIEVEIFDLRGEGPTGPQEGFLEKIPERKIYLFWIMKSGDAIELEAIAASLKSRDAQCVTIAGGTHVDMCTARALEYFDKVVTGPGESALWEAINSVGDSSQRLFRGDYKVDRFDSTPYPDRSLLPAERVINSKLFSQYGEEPATSIYMSRGCIYRCGFCVYNVPNELQVRHPEMLRSEIQYLKSTYKIKAINLRDEVAIHPSPKISEQCLNILKDEGVIWRGQTTTLASTKQLKLAAESGCVELSVGVETVDPKVMKIIKKDWQNLTGIRRFFADAKEFGIKVKICLILGLPGESADIVEKTVKFLEEIDPDFASVSGFCPVPGSPIAKDPESYGIEMIDQDLSKHAHLLYRFSKDEEVGLPFRYKPDGPWGPTFTREQIIGNIQKIQDWLSSRNKTY
ncbi:MAG: radical SAM protein [Candidatus Sericytochromatia bacterium]|nr:radical SAM protein [Candidatus Sericytochromatia bacterium]